MTGGSGSGGRGPGGRPARRAAAGRRRRSAPSSAGCPTARAGRCRAGWPRARRRRPVGAAAGRPGPGDQVDQHAEELAAGVAQADLVAAQQVVAEHQLEHAAVGAGEVEVDAGPARAAAARGSRVVADSGGDLLAEVLVALPGDGGQQRLGGWGSSGAGRRARPRPAGRSRAATGPGCPRGPAGRRRPRPGGREGRVRSGIDSVYHTA